MINRSVPHVLVIEKDRQVRRLLQLTLGKIGYHILLANTVGEGIVHTRLNAPDLIILDIDNVEGDALAVLHQLHDCVKSPVIVLSAREGELDIVRSLESGADDYIVKPFRTEELIARLRVAVRRQSEEEEVSLSLGSLTVDFRARIVWNGDEQVKLTPTEYALLRLFVRNAGKVLTHKYILEQIWGDNCKEETGYLRVYVGQLRKKIGDDPTGPRHILTASGIGYGWVLEPGPMKPSVRTA